MKIFFRFKETSTEFSINVASFLAKKRAHYGFGIKDNLITLLNHYYVSYSFDKTNN